MRIAWEGRELYCHISTKAGFDPVKTLYVCAPGADAASYEAAARFAQASGCLPLFTRQANAASCTADSI